ncbi:MAG: S41 family peptidase [Ferruginibacter sp.]
MKKWFNLQFQCCLQAHNKERKITTIETGNFKEYYPDSIKIKNTSKLIEYKILANNIGYIKINNSLGNNMLIFDFDKAIDSLMTTKSIILDLTETPSGGNSTVAKAIMGRFISKKLPYQQHEYDELAYETKSSWVEYVSPRKTQYKSQVVIMVGHWTGSMGEGIAIGFDAMKRATVIGTKMAGLIGAINGFTLSETKIGFQFPTERLYHINGIAREDYEPKILTKNSNETWKIARKKLMPN